MTANAGRTPKAPSLKLIGGRGNGTDSGGRKVKKPPLFKRSVPAAPAWLSPTARAEWDRVVPELSRLDLLKEIDGSALSAYCEMVDLFVRATADVHEAGLTVENHSVRKDGTKSTWFTANPAVAVQLKAQAAVRAWCAEFGLTPSAEGRIGKVGGDDERDINPFAG